MGDKSLFQGRLDSSYVISVVLELGFQISELIIFLPILSGNIGATIRFFSIFVSLLKVFKNITHILFCKWLIRRIQ